MDGHVWVPLSILTLALEKPLPRIHPLPGLTSIASRILSPVDNDCKILELLELLMPANRESTIAP